jgi:4-amino-4-deoxy-L-arabinose transferase-like glycosyltransferase
MAAWRASPAGLCSPVTCYPTAAPENATLHEEADAAQESYAGGAATSRGKSHAGLTESIYCIVLIALLLRLAVIGFGHTYRITPRRDHFQFGWEMGRIARSIAQGDGFSSPTDLPTGPTAWAPPLYPYLLAGVFKLLGTYTRAAAFTILALNSIFAALTTLVIYRIGFRTIGPTPARWAAWIWAVFPYTIYWAVRVVWETSLSALLLSLAVLQSLRAVDDPEQKVTPAIVLGLIFGAIALTNPTMLSVLPFFLAWFWRRWRGQGKPAGKPIAAVLLACLAISAPWLIRNYAVFHRFIFVRDNFWMELHLANNARSGGFWTRSEHPGNDPEQMKRFQQLGEISYMGQERQEALDFIRENPGLFLRYNLQRAVYFWIGNPQRTLVGNWDFGPARHTAFLLSAVGAWVGLWLAYRKRVCGRFLFAILLIVYPLPYYIAHPSPRYRHAVEPVMILLIAYAFYLARGRRFKAHAPA